MTETLLLDKVTMIYVPGEDRMKMQAQIKGGDVAHLWLTQRLCKGLIPIMIQHIESTVEKAAQSQNQITSPAQSESIQSFYQDRALGQKGDSTPVAAAEDPAVEELVLKLDISRNENGIVLKFPTSSDRLALLPLTMVHARQWLSILYTLFVQASWSEDIWPEWVKESAPQQKSARAEMVVH